MNIGHGFGRWNPETKLFMDAAKQTFRGGALRFLEKIETFFQLETNSVEGDVRVPIIERVKAAENRAYHNIAIDRSNHEYLPLLARISGIMSVYGFGRISLELEDA